MEKITSYLISGKISSNSSEAHALFEKSRLGEKIDQKIVYSLPESLFLVGQNKMSILDKNDKKIDQKELIKKFERLDKNFLSKYIVFKNLRKSGYIPKTALKFGSDFRVYDKGNKIKENHSKWICFVVSENSKFTWQDFVAKNRVAHSTKKNLLIAIVDEESSVSYFEVKWTKIQ